MKTLVLVTFLALAPLSVVADQPPTQHDIDFATEVKDTLKQRLLALLLNEFENTTVDNFAAGDEAISLVFDDSHSNFRLVGDLKPLRKNDVPQDTWERAALDAAKKGNEFGPETLTINGKYYIRQSFPLSNFHPSCSICHQNFGPVNKGQYVGALMLRVPVIARTKTK